MPLTCEMLDEKGSQSGKLMIDRNYLLFAFPATLGREENAEKLTTILENFLNKNEIFDEAGMISPAIFLGMSDDLRHDAFEHISEYDGYDCIHIHMRHITDIDAKMVENFFTSIEKHSIKDTNIDLIMSKQNRVEILATANKYFKELATKSSAKTIEKFYRQTKKEEYGRAEAKMVADGTLDEKATHPAIDSNDDIMNFRKQPSM